MIVRSRTFFACARFIACAVLLGPIFAADLQAGGVVPRKPFLGHERLALLEVTKSIGPSDITVWGNRVKHFALSVKIVAQIPPDVNMPKQQQLGVSHTRPPQFWGPIFGTQDWFPVEVGKRIVVAFNGDKLPEGMTPSEAGMAPVLASSPRAETVWHDCQTFYDAIRPAKEAPPAPALTRSLRQQQQQLGASFFYLIEYYDRRIVDDKAFSLAAAEYLRNSSVPLKERMAIVQSLSEAVERDPESHRALVSALIQLALEAKKEAKHADLTPTQLCNLLRELSAQFVSRKPVEALPKVESPAREELLKMAKDKQIVTYDRAGVIPLINWLEGRVPGEIPQRGANEARQLDGWKPRKLEPTPRPEEPQPLVAPVAKADSLSWQKVAAIIANVFLGGLALLLVAILLLRKRRASP